MQAKTAKRVAHLVKQTPTGWQTQTRDLDRADVPPSTVAAFPTEQEAERLARHLILQAKRESGKRPPVDRTGGLAMTWDEEEDEDRDFSGRGFSLRPLMGRDSGRLLNGGRVVRKPLGRSA